MAATNDGRGRGRTGQPVYITNATGDPVPTTGGGGGAGVVARSLLPTAQISRKARRPTPPQPRTPVRLA